MARSIGSTSLDTHWCLEEISRNIYSGVLILINIDSRVKEKLLIVLVCWLLAISFIYKIPKMIKVWNASIVSRKH